MGKHDKALEYFEVSLKLAEELKDMDFQSENYGCMSESYYEIGNFKTAYDYFKMYKNAEDTLSNKEIAAELNTIKTKYDGEKNKKKLSY